MNETPAMSPDLETRAAARAGLFQWAAGHGGQRVGPQQIVQDLGDQLTAAGLALLRISVSLLDYRPDYLGRQYIWFAAQTVEAVDRRYTLVRSPDYLTSPIRVIQEGAAALRRRLVDGAGAEFPVLEELRAAGATDFAAFALNFADGSRQYISFASAAPQGFTSDDLAFLEALLPQLSLRLEVEHAREAMDQLLRTYLGDFAAPRVVSGSFRRVRGETIHAVILACDMRGFTQMTDALDADAVFAALSVYYDAIADPVLKAGGDVVKMIADGVLAVFPAGAALRPTAEAALTATREAVAALDALMPEDLPPGAFPLRAGFALHAGEVTFGNVGSRGRLDYTLIGPAVNEAFRIEAKTKELQRSILMSAPFAQWLGGAGLESLGLHELKGVRAPKELFALARRKSVKSSDRVDLGVGEGAGHDGDRYREAVSAGDS